MNVTNVNVDLTSGTVTVAFQDGTSQIVTAPTVPATQGVSLEDLQKVEADVAQTETDVQAAEAKLPAVDPVEAPAEPQVEAPVDTSTTN